MGADNQANRVLARAAYREELAKVFHRAFRWENDPWDEISEKERWWTIRGITAVIERINADINGRAR